MDKKIAVVTGSARGIGRAVAEALAAKGMIPVIADIDLEKAEDTSAEISGRTGHGMAVMMDVSDIGSVTAGVEKIIRKYGTIHVLVNNAGILQTNQIKDITEEEWDRVMGVNLKGAFFLFQRVLPWMENQRWGRVINISSLAGRMGGYGNGVVYSASKAGLIGLSYSLARRVAELGITVNTLAPGTSETELVRQFPPERLASLREMIPMKRLGKPEETAAAAAFLASEEAGFITGAVIDINGGLFMG